MSLPTPTAPWVISPIRGSGNWLAQFVYTPLGIGVGNDPNTAIATTASKAKFTTNTDYRIAGTLYNKVATDDFWTLDTSANLSTSEGIIVLLCVNAAGVASVVYGAVAAAGAEVAPADPTDRAVFAELSIETDGTHTFTGGTTALNAVGVTAAFADRLAADFVAVDAISDFLEIYHLPITTVDIDGTFDGASVDLLGFNVNDAANTPKNLHAVHDGTVTFTGKTTAFLASAIENPRYLVGQISSIGFNTELTISITCVDLKGK